MGWARGIVDGREVGYSVEGVCEEDGCNEAIDFGLGYACGGDHGASDRSCERYFCGAHLFFGENVQLCRECLADEEAGIEEDDEEDATPSAPAGGTLRVTAPGSR